MLLGFELFPLTISILLTFAIPIVLLIQCQQYNSHLAYYIVMSVFFFYILINIFNLPFYLNLCINDSLYNSEYCSCCPICEIRSILLQLTIGVSAIAIMLNQNLLKIYKWNLKSFFLSILASCLLLLLKLIF